MGKFSLASAPLSAKLFMTALIVMVGLAYLSLLASIQEDTEMKRSLVAQAYGGMEKMELTQHTKEYLPYYIIFLFAVPVSLFMLSTYPEKLKRAFAVLPFALIIIDIGSMWGIPFVNATVFSWTLMIAGTLLATTFATLCLLNLINIWFGKVPPNPR
jgi:hypothetical protein